MIKSLEFRLPTTTSSNYGDRIFLKYPINPRPKQGSEVAQNCLYYQITPEAFAEISDNTFFQIIQLFK